MFKKIFPCCTDICAVLTYADGTIERRPVLAFGFFYESKDDLEPEFWPFTFDAEKGIEELKPELLDNVVSVKYETDGYSKTEG